MLIPRTIKEGIEITSGADGQTLLEEVMKNPSYKVGSNVPAGYSNGGDMNGLVVNHNKRIISVVCSLR